MITAAADPSKSDLMPGHPGHYAVVIATRGDGYNATEPSVAAKQFAGWLAAANGGGLHSSSIHLLTPTNEPEQQDPKSYEIARVLSQLGLGASSTVGERLYLYLAGRGRHEAGNFKLILESAD